jgi:hypothetical protein
VTQPFLLLCLSHFLLLWLNYFLKFHETFLRFLALQWLSHFCYSDSVIYRFYQAFLLQCLSHFLFCQSFLRFRPRVIVTQSFCYSDSVILCDFISHFEISSCVIVIRSFLLQYSSIFAAPPQLFSDFVMSRYSNSAILWFVNHFTIFLISLDIFEISLNHS